MRNSLPETPLSVSEREILFGLLAVIALVSAYFSFSGALLVLQELGDDIFVRVGAAVYALGSWAVLYILWRHSFLTLPFIKRPQIAVAAISVALTCTFALGLSATMNVAHLAGGVSQRAHMAMMTETAASVSDVHHRSVQRVGDLSSDIGERAADFLRMAEADRKNGRYSGFSGGGAFTNAAETIGAGLAGLKVRIDQTVAESHAASEQARLHLETMRETALRQDASPKARIAEIENELGALRSTLGAVSAESLAGLIRRELNRMTRVAEGMEPTSRRADIRAGQAKAIAVLQSRMAETAETLGGVVDALTAVDSGDALRFEPMSVMRGIFAYWDQFIPQWVGGIAIDLAPLVIVLLLTLRVQMQRAGAVEDGPSDLTGEQIENAIDQAMRIMAASKGLAASPAALPAPQDALRADDAPDPTSALPPAPMRDVWARKDD